MSRILGMLKSRVSTAKFDARFGQGTCFVSAVLFLILAITKVSSMTLSEAEFLMLLLASLSVSLLLVILGLILPWSQQQAALPK